MDYHEIRSLTLVRYNKELYGVWDDDWDERSARLLPLDTVIHYEGDEEAADAQAVVAPYRQMERIEPVKADAETVRALFRLDVMPWELAQQGRYWKSSLSKAAFMRFGSTPMPTTAATASCPVIGGKRNRACCGCSTRMAIRPKGRLLPLTRWDIFITAAVSVSRTVKRRSAVSHTLRSMRVP